MLIGNYPPGRIRAGRKDHKMFDKIFEEISSNARCNNYACDNHDIERAAYTAGRFTAYCNVLRMMGNEVDDGTYNDDGCNRISYLRLNGEMLMKNGDWQEAYWDYSSRFHTQLSQDQEENDE